MNTAQPPPPAAPPVRFYDNRQKYLAFVSYCNEKQVIARRLASELPSIHPKPPAMRVFDAGMGDATVLTRTMRSCHCAFRTVPLLAVAKEISLEDVRRGLDKMPDRFQEHPATVVVLTNLSYAEAPQWRLRDGGTINWQVGRLQGNCSEDYARQIEGLEPLLAHGWENRPSPSTGNPVYARPTVLVLYREDHEFLLNDVIPRQDAPAAGYDLIIASQPWRAGTSAQFKASRILAPLSRNLAAGGRLVIIQSAGKDPGLEIVQRVWPGELPFKVDRYQLVAALKDELGREMQDYRIANLPDDAAIFRYEMHPLAAEMGDRIGTSTLFAAWNAAVYVAQIEDERLAAVPDSVYREATRDVLRKFGGLWFNDETFVVARCSR